MEFLYIQSRYNGSAKSSSTDSNPMKKNLGLLISINKPINETHIVFRTHNLTKSLTKLNNKASPSTTRPSQQNSSTTPINNPIFGTFSPAHLQKVCLLSSHGLTPKNSGSRKPRRFDHTLTLLPLTVCTKHDTSGFLPYDYVRRMAEYTCTTKYKNSILKVVHSFEDCILKFPLPAPLGSSEEVYYSDRDFSRHCYQCLIVLPIRKTIYMYRDYRFCSHGCRMKACATKYWYAKMMKFSDDDDNDQEIFTIEIC